MRKWAFLLVVATALVVTNAFAAGAAKDPLRIVLQRSDVPAKAKYVSGRFPAFEKGLAGAGITGDAAFHHSNLQRSATRTEMISGLVVVLGSAGDARKTYRLIKDELDPKPGSTLRLPAHGDQQFAFWTQSVGKAELLVRKGSVVWQLEVNPDTGTKAQTVAQLNAYAIKQRRRIG